MFFRSSPIVALGVFTATIAIISLYTITGMFFWSFPAVVLGMCVEIIALISLYVITGIWVMFVFNSLVSLVHMIFVVYLLRPRVVGLPCVGDLL